MGKEGDAAGGDPPSNFQLPSSNFIKKETAIKSVPLFTLTYFNSHKQFSFHVSFPEASTSPAQVFHRLSDL